MKLPDRICWFASILIAAVLSSSCGKEELPVPADTTPASVYKYGLKDLARANGLVIGAEFSYATYQKDDSLKVVLRRDFEAVTFGNEMKHDNILKSSGQFDFSKADVMAGWTRDCGLELFGHTLGWHSQQQTDYLNRLISGAADAQEADALVRKAHKSWVEAMVGHFDVYGWDVVNEVFTDSGEWRGRDDIDTGEYHKFDWGSHYPGGTKGFVDSAFHNARVALESTGRSADLYINDYNLEWSSAKLEALCSYAESNPDVTGVGTQMHVNSDVNRDKVRLMLQRMAATGKKVRISELDVAQAGVDQGETIVYIFDQYLRIVPEAQRGGITFWGVSDRNSWRGSEKAPLLYDSRYRRKDAYLKLHAFLLERSEL